MSQDKTSMIPKAPTGIDGFDKITYGGLPRGGATLVTGLPGCGKTIFALHFLAAGVEDCDEGGVYLTFQEKPAKLEATGRAMGLDIAGLVGKNRISVDHVSFGNTLVTETPDYTLDGLFIRIEEQLALVRGKRLVIDSIENLFELLSDARTLRFELRRLLAWLEERGVTTILIGESHDRRHLETLSEQYACECVVFLDNRVTEETSTRRLRIPKYRGSRHGSNEYPFLISEKGLTVLPLSHIALEYEVPTDRISMGVPGLDDMFEGGIYRGSVVLFSGTAGAGKTTFANNMIHAACQREERCLYLAMEESESQIVRNLRSTGLEVQPHIDAGFLVYNTSRPVHLSLEEHLIRNFQLIEDMAPANVVIDPMTHLTKAGNSFQATSFLMRLTSFLKARGITTIITDLIHHGSTVEQTSSDFSSFIDVWLLLQSEVANGERTNTLQVLKARGTGHSRQLREFRFFSEGIDIFDVYTGPAGAVTGVARVVQEEKDRHRFAMRQRELEQLELEAARRREKHEAKIAALRAELVGELGEIERLQEIAKADLELAELERTRLEVMRSGSPEKEAKEGSP